MAATTNFIPLSPSLGVAAETNPLNLTAMHVEETSIPPTSVSSSSPVSEAEKAATGVADKPAPVMASTRLQKLISDTNGLIVCPGVYDGLSTRIAHEVGFDALYMTGAGTTASRLGMADLGLAQLSDMRENAEMIASLDPFGPPLVADIDTGYGGKSFFFVPNARSITLDDRARHSQHLAVGTAKQTLLTDLAGPMMVAKSVSQYIRAGVAGFHLEDQVLSKRCGHLGGKKVVPREEYYARLRAAQSARTRLQSDIVFIARTDALQSCGYDECIERLKYARDMGADVGLMEGPTSKEMAQQVVKDLAPWPLLLNMVENGSTPVITTREAESYGYRLMIFSFASLTPAYSAIKETLQRLKNQGIVGTDKSLSPRKLFEVCGLGELMKLDAEAGGLAFQNGV